MKHIDKLAEKIEKEQDKIRILFNYKFHLAENQEEADEIQEDIIQGLNNFLDLVENDEEDEEYNNEED